MSYRKIYQDLIEHYMFEPWDNITRDAIEHNFKIQCPGPYSIEWYEELRDDLLPHFKIIFADPVEETAWYLRWS